MPFTIISRLLSFKINLVLSKEVVMILVSGAAGLSGAMVIQELARQKVPARALVRQRAKAHIIEHLPSIQVVEGDMLRPETLSFALEGIERVLMISSANQQMFETQCAFIDACKNAGVSHVVKFSGAELGFDPKKFLFTHMHEDIERYLERSGLLWTHLRPSQFMQVYLREAATIIRDNAFYLPLADIQLAPIDLHDVARIAVALLRHGGHAGKSYDMTGPEALTMSEIAERISQAVGRTIRYVPVTIEERRHTLLGRGMPPYFVDALDDQTHERLLHPIARVSLAAHETFDIEPTTFAEFARLNVDAFCVRA